MDLQYKRVEWTELKVGDVVSVSRGLEELLAIREYPPHGKTLVFGSGHTEIQYDLRDATGKLAQYLRVLRLEEGGQTVPEILLGFCPITRGTPEEVVAGYRRRKAVILEEMASAVSW